MAHWTALLSQRSYFTGARSVSAPHGPNTSRWQRFKQFFSAGPAVPTFASCAPLPCLPAVRDPLVTIVAKGPDDGDLLIDTDETTVYIRETEYPALWARVSGLLRSGVICGASR